LLLDIKNIFERAFEQAFKLFQISGKQTHDASPLGFLGGFFPTQTPSNKLLLLKMKRRYRRIIRSVNSRRFWCNAGGGTELSGPAFNQK
jgi:hypothetical protein